MVTLAPNLTEIIYALGEEDKLVGNTILCDYPLQAKNVYKIGNFNNPSIERIISKGTNIVLATDGNPDDKLKFLEKNNIKVLKFQPQKVNEISDMIKIISKEIGAAEKGNKLASKIDISIKNLIRNNVNKKRKFVFILQFDPIYTFSEETWIGDIFKLGGFINIIGNSPVKYPKITDEFLLKNKPDIFFLGNIEGKSKEESIEIYKTKLGKIYGDLKEKFNIVIVPKDILVRPGPRIIEGIKFLESIKS
ncbi:helical backbone metal receptor [Pigmentibacter sp. JX0631]|nr:helical backbone metal receptor [Pigmentibacter sp. JX0631]WGL61546.1 helical backbone metal receptor [Pigmentibacter sp. JX0631]